MSHLLVASARLRPHRAPVTSEPARQRVHAHALRACCSHSVHFLVGEACSRSFLWFRRRPDQRVIGSVLGLGILADALIPGGNKPLNPWSPVPAAFHRVHPVMSLLGPASGWGELVSPVAAGGVDDVFAEDLSGVGVDDGDGRFVDECEDGFAAVVVADAEVVHACGAAQAHLSVRADVVVADSEVSFAEIRGDCFR